MQLLKAKKKFIKDFIIENIDDLEEIKIDDLLKAFFEINKKHEIISYYPLFHNIETYRNTLYCEENKNDFMHGMTII